MIEKIPYFNPHKHPEFIGGVMVPPGEAREIDPTHHPKYRADVAETVLAAPTHIVDVLLAGTSANILAALPSLAIEDVEQLGEKEQEGAARKEVLAAVVERLLKNASAQHDTLVQGGTGENSGEQLGGEGGEKSGSSAADSGGQPVIIGVDLASSSDTTTVALVDLAAGADTPVVVQVDVLAPAAETATPAKAAKK